MSIAKAFRKLVSCVLLDLDGTLLNTDGIVNDALKVYLVKYGKQWDGRGAQRIIGKTPYEAAAVIVEDYKLPITANELLSEINPILSDKWCNIKAQPGANRLINHLREHGVPMALASNSSKENIETKISYHPGWKESFSVIIGGNEVTCPKPSPEIYLEAAKRLKMDASSCLVIEDSIMSIAKAFRKLVSCVLLDLDGTLPNTDGIVNDVLKVYLVKYGKQWDGRVAHKIIGKTPYEVAAVIVEDYKLPVTIDEFLSEITPIFSDKWCNIKAQPGANRLINHLRGHDVPMALASNSYYPGWKESFSVIIGGDEVTCGKPSPGM